MSTELKIIYKWMITGILKERDEVDLLETYEKPFSIANMIEAMNIEIMHPKSWYR